MANINKLIEILIEDNLPNQLITPIYETYKHNFTTRRILSDISVL